MKTFPEKEKLPQIILVLSAFLFLGLIIVLAKVIGDGPIVPIIFSIGWLVYFCFVVRYFLKSRNKQNR